MKQLFSDVDKKQQKNIGPGEKGGQINMIILILFLEAISKQECRESKANIVW